jgi:CRP-like cAMP-binding protein
MGPNQGIGRILDPRPSASATPSIESAVHSATLLDLEILRSFCAEMCFASGDRLRTKGQHYENMYLITRGAVRVDLESARGAADPIIVGAGRPVGEIAFLRGWPATATVTATANGSALVVNDLALAHLENQHPVLASQLWRYLAETAEERTSANLTLIPSARAALRTLEVHLCRNAAMLESAQKLRYEVYCQELGRQSPYADHQSKVIADGLDNTGHTFIAVEAGETVGTLRGNRPSEGALGALEELYGMRASPHYPSSTAICTKFVVKKSKRRSPAAMLLIAAMVRYGVRNDIKECYIDCVPALLPYYKAIGFRITGPPFLHRENGLSFPMMIELAKHGPRLSAEFKPWNYVALYLNAKLLRWIDSARELVSGSMPLPGGK